jgi:hypothetical protein
MDQLSKDAPRVEASRRPTHGRKTLRMALWGWRTASMLERLSEIMGWLVA